MITKGILGIKGSTEQIFTDEGDRIPVTRIDTSPCFVVGMKTMDTDGYWAIQLAFGETKHIKKSAMGLFTKAGMKAPLHFLREVRFDTAEVIEDGKKKGLKVADLELWIGQELKASDLFNKGEDVTVTGISKGKGFQGVVKRHGFRGGKRTHGQSDRERAPGSIGSGTTIGRVFKGKRMAGRMGTDTVTIKNLDVVEATEDGLVLKGIIPGNPGGLIIIRSSAAVPVKEVVAEEPEVADVPVTADEPKVEEPVVETPPVEEVSA